MAAGKKALGGLSFFPKGKRAKHMATAKEKNSPTRRKLHFPRGGKCCGHHRARPCLLCRRIQSLTAGKPDDTLTPGQARKATHPVPKGFPTQGPTVCLHLHQPARKGRGPFPAISWVPFRAEGRSPGGDLSEKTPTMVTHKIDESRVCEKKSGSHHGRRGGGEGGKRNRRKKEGRAGSGAGTVGWMVGGGGSVSGGGSRPANPFGPAGEDTTSYTFRGRGEVLHPQIGERLPALFHRSHVLLVYSL